MITSIKILAIIVILYWIIAKIVNKIREAEREEGRLPAPLWGLIVAIMAVVISCFVVLLRHIVKLRG